jgi:CHAT domain-containing protein
MHALTTQSEYNRGYLLYLIGRSLDARRVLQSVEKEFENQHDEFNLAQCRLDRADVLIELNLPEHAAGLAAAAEAAFSRLGASSDRARALLISGRCAFKQNDLRRAEASLEQARSIFRAEGNKVWACLVDLERAGVLLAARNVDAAWSVAVQAAESLPPADHPVFAVQSQLVQARIRIAQGKPAEALQLVRDLQGAALPAWLEYQLEYLQGRALELCGDGEAAIASYTGAVELLEFLGANVFLDDVMLRLSADKPDAYLRLVELTKDPARAFDYLERFRSHMLPRVARQSDDIDVTPIVRDIRQALRMSYLELLQKPSMPDAGVIDRIRQQEQQLMERVREYRIAQQEPSLMPSRQVPRPAEEEPVIVEYLVDGGRVQAFVVQAGRVQRFRLGISAVDVERKVAFVHHYLHSDDPAGRSGLDRHLAVLYEELIGPFEETLGTDVVVVPDGCLRDLPFHALRAPWGTVLERYTVSYAPSAESYRAADRRLRHPENASILVGVDLPDIPSVQEEIRAAAMCLPNPVICNRPDVAGLPEAFSRAAFVHIASHGFFRKDDPSFSMLLLGSDVLTPSDIGTLRMEAELVTMSACSTGRLLAPDVQGFLRAFLILGVPSLVGSLWDVDDRSTAELMRHFYSNLRQGPDVAVALRQAMFEMRAQNDHPRYWAPFMLVGRRRLKDSWKFLQNQCTDSRSGRDLLV